MKKLSELDNRDRVNLDYLLSLDDREMEKFAKSLDEDNLGYALELLIAYRADLEVRKLDSMDFVSDVREARKVLDKFTIRG